MPASRTPYSPCKLYYDAAVVVSEGHYLLTPAGSGYFVTGVRQDGKRAHRKHLSCLRWPAAEIPEGATVHNLVWYTRKKRVQCGRAG